ncbi:MAG: DNA-3-methyladenine glycosylase 2 family protein [Actinobacteria bacterium]|nr:DNA-3-methyladenine glycosylase 2 family protein [Actinomycetota bacterium]
MSFELAPRGPFSLADENEYFGGWPAFPGDERAVAMTFPVEGWRSSATVIVRQYASGGIGGEVHGAAHQAETAWRQALAVLSLDVDGSAFAEVGERDPVIGRLQKAYRAVRPVLFHSPYEAAACLILGHRISMRQARATREIMAQLLGDEVTVEGHPTRAFPQPRVLLEMTSFPGVTEEKIHRLNGIGRAALEGVLDRAHLRGLAVETALEELRGLEGVGPFTAQGILFRGAGLVDEVTDDEVTAQAVQRAYDLPDLPDRSEVLRIADGWRPFRTWCLVLLHIWLRREAGGPVRPTRS